MQRKDRARLRRSWWRRWGSYHGKQRKNVLATLFQKDRMSTGRRHSVDINSVSRLFGGVHVAWALLSPPT